MCDCPAWTECPDCEGSGFAFRDDDEAFVDRKCPTCDGLGGWHERREFPDKTLGGLRPDALHLLGVSEAWMMGETEDFDG